MELGLRVSWLYTEKSNIAKLHMAKAQTPSPRPDSPR